MFGASRCSQELPFQFDGQPTPTADLPFCYDSSVPSSRKVIAVSGTAHPCLQLRGTPLFCASPYGLAADSGFNG